MKNRVPTIMSSNVTVRLHFERIALKVHGFFTTVHSVCGFMPSKIGGFVIRLFTLSVLHTHRGCAIASASYRRTCEPSRIQRAS